MVESNQLMEAAQEQEPAQVYRMGSRLYRCHECENEEKKMINLVDPRCSKCNSNFIEFLSKSSEPTHFQSATQSQPAQNQTHVTQQSMFEEQKSTAPPNVRTREDFRNVYSVSDSSGAPVNFERRERERQEERRRQQEMHQAQQEAQQQQQNAQSNHRQHFQNQQQPFGAFMGSGFPNQSDFFPEDVFNQVFGGNRFNNLFDDIFGQNGMGGVFQNMPQNFQQNYDANFRSSHAGSGFDFFDDIAQHIADMTAAESEAPRKPTDKATMEKLPVLNLTEKHCKKGPDGKLECPVCPVCTEDIKVGDKAMLMPCAHTFHPDCLKPWLKDHNTCPVCRHELPQQKSNNSTDFFSQFRN